MTDTHSDGTNDHEGLTSKAVEEKYGGQSEDDLQDTGNTGSEKSLSN